MYNSPTSFIIPLLVFLIYRASTCTNEVDYCVSCTNGNECASCSLGYGLHYTSDASGAALTYCQACLSGCRRCTVYNSCDQCNIGYRMYTINSINRCQACRVQNCQYCTSSISTCSSCAPYFTVKNNICQPCQDPNCLRCIDKPQECTQCCCQLGLDNNNNTCRSCNDVNCVSCTSNYLRCRACDTGFGVSSSFTCVACVQANCVKCSTNAQICEQCQVDYGAIDGVCVSCLSRNCTNCSQSNGRVCYSCITDYNLYSSTCLTCNDPYCQSCPSNINSCQVCDPGFGVISPVDNYPYCIECYANCLTCLGTSYSSCTSCPNGVSYLNGYSCVPCTYLSNCLQCTNDGHCTLCMDNLYINSMGACVTCPIYCTLCFYNPIYNTPECTQCQPTYMLVMSQPPSCREECGDYVAFTSPCDDQLRVPYDGCNDICEVQDGFQCRKVNYTSTCSYINQVYLEILDVVREEFANAFTMRVKVWPPLYVFKTSDLKGVFFIDDPTFTIESITLDPQTNELVFKVAFSEDYLDKNILVEFIPSESVDNRYFASVTSNALKLVSLVHYPEWVLQSSKISLYLLYFVMVMGNIGAVIGLIGKRLAGLEAMFVYQLAFLSIVWVNSPLYIPFQIIYPLKYTNGYHKQDLVPSSSAASSRLLATSEFNTYTYPYPHTEQFWFDERMFVNNFNIFFMFQILCLLSYLITSAVFAYVRKKNMAILKQNLQVDKIAKIKTYLNRITSAREYSATGMLYFGLLTLVHFVACSYLFFVRSQLDLVNLIFFGIVAFTYSIMGFFFWFDPDPFDYFRYSFKKTRTAMSFYYILPFLLATSVLVMMIFKLTWPPLIPIAVFLPYVLIYQPYKQRMENFRFAFYLMVMIMWLTIRLLLEFYGQDSRRNYVFILNLISILLLIMVTVTSYISLIYYIHYYYFKQKNIKNEEQQVMFQLEMIDVRQKMESIRQEDLVFKKLLQPRMNIMEFSNSLKPLDNDFLHEYSSVESVTKKIKKDMEEQRIKKPKMILQSANQKKKVIQNLRETIQFKQLPKQEVQKNAKLIYAMEVLNNENEFIRLKNAKDFTLKMIEETNEEHHEEYMINYNKI